MSGPAGYFYLHATPRYRSTIHLFHHIVIQKDSDISTIHPVFQRLSIHRLASYSGIHSPRDKETRDKAYIPRAAFRLSESSFVTLGTVERSGLVRTWRLEVTDFLRPVGAGTWHCWLYKRGPRDKDPSTRRSRRRASDGYRKPFPRPAKVIR